MVFHIVSGLGRLVLLSQQLTFGIVATHQVRPVINTQLPIQMLTDQHPTAGHAVAKLLRLDLQNFALVADRVVIADHPVLLA